jgi:N-acetylglutamate synthase-like GNAT family acetyltransferase
MKEFMTIIRNPISSDKNQILSFCKKTFSWGDYIPEVWDSWQKDNGLVIIEKDNTAVAMCHGVKFQNENMLWIEGIRVKENYRKNGFATSLIKYFEKIANDFGIKHLNMLVETENTQSLNLVKKLGYQIISKWNYFSLQSKKNSHTRIKFESVDINELKNFKNIRFVESWRWIPLTKDNFENLNFHDNILCQKNDGEVQSLGIISESNSFEDTIILTIVFGRYADIHKMIWYTQNLSVKKGYSKIRILTENDDLKMNNVGNKFPFYLVGKTL